MFRWYFGRNEVFIRSFWFLLTFRKESNVTKHLSHCPNIYTVAKRANLEGFSIFELRRAINLNPVTCTTPLTIKWPNHIKMTRLDLLCTLVAAGDIQFILFHTVWTREILIWKKNPSSFQKFNLILATINSIIYYWLLWFKSTFSSVDFVTFLQLLWFIRFIKLSCYWEYTTKPHPSISHSFLWLGNLIHDL